MMTTEVEIEVIDLHKSFGGHPVLRGIDLSIFRGDTLAIVGVSGCGKTVLLSHILGKLHPDQGRVLVTDHDAPGHPLRDLRSINSFATDKLHQHWGVVFQRNALFSGTVYDNIALWLREIKGLSDQQIQPIARHCLNQVSLDDSDDFLRTDQHELSGGMAKRLAIARALAMQPVVLFYDEPTTGLDPATAAQMHDLIHATHLPEPGSGIQRTTVIITHDKDLLMRLQPRIIMLDAGAVCFDGPFEEFEASDSAIIRPYFDRMPVLHGQVEKVTDT